MKNIHVLPTYKETRLHNTFCILRLEREYDLSPCNVNICITSDKEIKEGHWFIRNGYLHRRTNYTKYHENDRKIILTTDQDLIKDGVQAIDNEFLEWFVKNPSCEEVETFKVWWSDDSYSYEIIIPKEEPKQDSLNQFLSTSGVMIKDPQKWEIPKQETLEEVAEKLTKDFPHYSVRDNMDDSDIKGWFLEALQKGVKWQQEQDKNKYSEEEVYNILIHHTVELFKKEPITLEGFWNKFKKK